MKKIKRHIIWLMAAIVLFGCSGNNDELLPDAQHPDVPEAQQPDVPGAELTIGLSASATGFVDASETGEDGGYQSAQTTRSWTPPAGYDLYNDIYDDNGNLFVNYANSNLNNKSINAFFTRATADEPEPSDPTYAFYPYHGRLRYMSTDNKWRLSINKVKPEDVTKGDYYVYGFIPSDAADDATIALLPGKTSYTEGAVLTIKGLRSVGYDACAIIGAKEGFDIEHDGDYTDTNSNNAYDEGTDTRTNRLTAGDFKFNLKTGNDVHNYLYLLFDHLCAALTIGIKIDGDYNTLRTIKLKELTLQSANDVSMSKQKVDVVVTLTKNTTGSNPITSLTYSQTGESETGATVYQSDEGLTLTTSYQTLLTHFLPIGVTKIIVTSVYDVYDKNTSPGHPEGNLVRQNCKATNTIKLSDIIAYFPGVNRGWRYNINMNLIPTYLYMLSEPDLNDPTVTVE